MLGNRLNYASTAQRMNSAGVPATARGFDHREYLLAVPDAVKLKLKEVEER